MIVIVIIERTLQNELLMSISWRYWCNHDDNDDDDDEFWMNLEFTRGRHLSSVASEFPWIDLYVYIEYLYIH